MAEDKKKEGRQVSWESRPVFRLEGEPLKGIAQAGYSVLFPSLWNISSETTDLAGNRQAGALLCPDARAHAH